MFEKDMMFPVLLDIYGGLLTDRKREVLDYYYNEDYSLSEISELTGISRQGVRDCIKKSEEEIYFFESKLNIAKKNREQASLVDDISNLLDEIAREIDEQSKDKICALIKMLSTLRSIDKTDGDAQE